MTSRALLPCRLCLTQFLQKPPCVSGKMDSVKQQMWFMGNSGYGEEEVRCTRMNLWQIGQRQWWCVCVWGVTLMKRSNSFAWMKLFISFQVVIMSSCVTTMRHDFGWMFAPHWLVGNLHDLSPSDGWSTRQKRKREREWERCSMQRQGKSALCNYVSLQWQVWITNFNSRAMKMIWSSLNCKETQTGTVMKICWDDMFCLRIHQTVLVRWKASVIHSWR